MSSLRFTVNSKKYASRRRKNERLNEDILVRNTLSSLERKKRTVTIASVLLLIRKSKASYYYLYLLHFK